VTDFKTSKMIFRPWDMKIWRYGAGFAGFPGFFGVLIFFRIPPKITLYLYIPIFQG
jgi:hypothetical protein